MSFFCIVEGRRTEVDLYPFWLSELNPKFTKVERIEDIQSPTQYCLQSGYGHPQIKNYILRARDIIKSNNIGLTHFIIIVDSEENTVAFRKQQYSTFIQQNFLGVPYSVEVIVQPICIETWLLGNTKLFTRRKKNSNLLQVFTQFYNVKQNDPELLPVLNGPVLAFATLKADFYYQYLKELINRRSSGRYTYKKEKPGFVRNKAYFNKLLERTKGNHLQEFKNMIAFLKSL